MPVKTGITVGFESPGTDPERKKKTPSKPASTAGAGDPHSVKPADKPDAGNTMSKKPRRMGDRNNQNMM